MLIVPCRDRPVLLQHFPTRSPTADGSQEAQRQQQQQQQQQQGQHNVMLSGPQVGSMLLGVPPHTLIYS